MPNATPVGKIRGMSAELAAKLKEHNLMNAEQLLMAGCEPKARQELAKLLGIEPKALLELINRADLDRVTGIGAAYADLLENAGVDTVKELSKRVPANLHAKLLEINDKLKLTNHPPTLEKVQAWVETAKSLPHIVEY